MGKLLLAPAAGFRLTHTRSRQRAVRTRTVESRRLGIKLSTLCHARPKRSTRATIPIDECARLSFSWNLRRTSGDSLVERDGFELPGDLIDEKPSKSVR